MSKEQRWKFDAAGWMFWLIVFAVFAGPCMYLVKKLVYSDTQWTVPVITGIVLAAVGAGVVSLIVNEILQRKQKKQRLQRRKKARKQK